MLQNRYNLPEGAVFHASGIMRDIKGGPKWLYPIFQAGVRWKLLFPEQGIDIPFTIKNHAFISHTGENQVHWERIFHFSKKKRYFNALMSLDDKQSIIQDYLGEPPLLYADLSLHVTENGGLTIQSLRQRLVLGKVEIPLPRIFQGLATVIERYDDEQELFHIHVTVRNPLIGRLFSYEGTFSTNEDT